MSSGNDQRRSGTALPPAASSDSTRSVLPQEERREIRRRAILSRDTLIAVIAVLLCAAVCVGLGRWQYGRFEDKRESAAIVEENYSADPVALDTILSSPDEELADGEEWTVVRLHGSYCSSPDCVLYVRNRTYSSTVGFYQLVPFIADDGTQLLVVRGWVPGDDEGAVPADAPAVPDGEITVDVRLRPAEQVLSQRSNPEGQVQTITPEEVAGMVPGLGDGLMLTVYGELAAEDPAGERPMALEKPDTSLGNHLSYAFQWWVFALFFPGALIYRTRRVIRDEEEDALDELRRQESSAAAASAAPLGSSPGAGAAADAADAAAADGAGADDAGTATSRTAADRSPAPRRADRADRPRRRVSVRARGIDEEEEDAIIDQHRG
ncbi:SURF1 family cytochrome oxidase biogenesis protein [Brachybacterium sp. DNPG3]